MAAQLPLRIVFLVALVLLVLLPLLAEQKPVKAQHQKKNKDHISNNKGIHLPLKARPSRILTRFARDKYVHFKKSNTVINNGEDLLTADKTTSMRKMKASTPGKVIPLPGNLTYWGEYFAYVGIGTPPQYVNLQVDTGTQSILIVLFCLHSLL